MSLIAFDQVNTYRSSPLLFSVIENMYMHKSVQSLAARLADKPIILAYIGKGYPHFKGESDKSVVSRLIAEYLLLMFAAKWKWDASVLPCFPPILDAIWTEHAADHEGYSEFRDSHIGHPLFDKDVPDYSLRSSLGNIFRTIHLYGIVPSSDDSMDTVEHLVKNGLWWPELIPPHGPLVLPTTPPQEAINDRFTNERGSKKRDLDEPVGEERTASAVDEAKDLGSPSKRPALEESGA
ncbi:hypothetical protein CYMTET_2856 [Cymbomonas tetramitiformis]|uniref:Uncharacterized protein n=1 Tax=Cymbomonas tetramitiformis TaxID=36881 RepID=A0AAE0LLN4_9CHLO|nr:hypothetical protein CYMTET_2856 [Cymbomonas tetramitiformis]